MCRPLTRRELLRYGGLAAATPLAASLWQPARAAAFAQVSSRATPINLELVTLTDTSAVLTWATVDPTAPTDEYGRPEPVPADTVVELGTSPLSMARVVERDDGTPFHYVELTGLEPGRPYWYRCLSNGRPAVPTQAFPEPPATGTFTTPLPPPGKFLFAMAWCNDVHIGEMTSGLAYTAPGGTGVPPGFAADPDNPYWRVMARAAVDEARDRGSELLLIAGDLTSEGKPVFMREARETFDRFGDYRRDYWVTRGNHDRAHQGAAWASCRPAAVPDYHDCLLDEFFPDGQTDFGFDRNGVHFVGLDTIDLTAGTGRFAADQAEWLAADLEAHDGMPTFVFGHHPVSEEARATALGAPGFSLSQADADRIESAIAGSSVVGVYSGHTHRNNRTSSPRVPGVPFVELAATKEYPGGYGVVRVHEGGYAVNFYKTRGDASRAWSERSRGEYLGLYPYYTLGSLEDRNFTITADFSDATRGPGFGNGPGGARGGGAFGGSAGGGDGGRSTVDELPATGGSEAALGAAALAASLAAARLARGA